MPASISVALVLPVAELGRADSDGLRRFIGQMQGLNDRAAAELALRREKIEGVLEPVVFVATLVTRPHPPDDHRAVRQLRKLIRLHQHPPVGKIDRQRLGLAKTPPGASPDQRADQPRCEPAIVGCKSVICRAAHPPDFFECGFCVRNGGLHRTSRISKPSQQIVETVMGP